MNIKYTVLFFNDQGKCIYTVEAESIEPKDKIKSNKYYVLSIKNPLGNLEFNEYVVKKNNRFCYSKKTKGKLEGRHTLPNNISMYSLIPFEAPANSLSFLKDIIEEEDLL
jgi:hypothetical protein